MTKLDKQIKEFQELINQLDTALLRRNPEFIKAVGIITEPQFATGLTLRDKGPMTMGELSRNIGIGLSNLTGIVDRLVKRKFVSRNRDENDRRVVRVHLTSLGRKIIDEYYQKKHEHIRPIITQLNQTERDALIELMKKIIDGLKENQSNKIQ